MANTRDHNRYVSIDDKDSLYLYYTITNKKQRKARIDSILAHKDNNGKIEKLRDIKKSISCDAGTEDDYARFVTENKSRISKDLLNSLRIKDKNLYQCLYNPTPDTKQPTFGSYFGLKCESIAQLYFWAPSTKEQYFSTINNQLSPLLSHKPMYQLTLQDYKDAVNELIRTYGEKSSKDYGEGRLQKFWSNISCVAEYAVIDGICAENPIKDLGRKINPLNKARREQHRRKSLNHQESQKSAEQIAISFPADGRVLGNAIQQYAGLRPAEVCGVNFRDVLYFTQKPDRCYLRVYTQVRNLKADSEINSYTGTLKTKNGYRFVPVVKELQALIEAKKKYLTNLGFTEEEIGKMPLANKRVSKRAASTEKTVLASLKTRCTPKDISDAGKSILHHAMGKHSILEVPYTDDTLSEDGEKVALNSITGSPIESDPQAYQFRRNFATQLFGICGMTSAEVQYLMGHVLEYDMYGRANDFVNEDRLLDLMHKMDRLISVTDVFAAGKGDLLESMSSSDPRSSLERIDLRQANCTVVVKFDDEIVKRLLIIPPSPSATITINVSLQAIEPNDPIIIDFHGSEDIFGNISSFPAPNIESPKKTTNILSKYYDTIFYCANDLSLSEDGSDNDEIELDDSQTQIDEDAISSQYDAGTDKIWAFYSDSDSDDDEED